MEYEIRPDGLEAAANARSTLKRKRQPDGLDIEQATNKLNQKIKSCTHNVELPPDFEDKRQLGESTYGMSG